MIIAITVVMIIGMLTLSVVSNSLHQLNGVAENDQQTASVHSAEGGVDLAISQMQSATTLSRLPCGIPTTNLVTNTITANYTVTVTYYDSSGNTLSCPAPSSSETYYAGSTSPATALIRSQGSSNSAAFGKQSMEAQVQLASNATTGAFFNGAIYSNSAMTWINKATISSSTGAANIYSNGDFICNNTSTIQGNVYVNGNFTATNVCNTTGSWWVNGFVLDKTGSSVGGSVIAAGSGTCATGYQVCFNSANGSVAGNVQAAGNVTSKETVTGGITQGKSGLTAPPMNFDQYDFKSSDWCGITGAVGNSYNCSTGYRLIEEANNGCTQAETDILSMAAATMPTVIYVPGTCTVGWTSSISIALAKNLIVFAEGGFKFGNTVNITSTGATQLYFVVPYSTGDWSNGSTGSTTTCTSQAGNPAVSTPGEWFVNTISFPTTNFYTFMYTPCEVYLNNQGAVAGQLYGGQVFLKNQVTFTYVPPSLPNQGASSSNLFNVALFYDRQVTP